MVMAMSMRVGYSLMYGAWDRDCEESEKSSGTSLERRTGDGSNSVERALASAESGVPGEARTSDKGGKVVIVNRATSAEGKCGCEHLSVQVLNSLSSTVVMRQHVIT